MNHYKRQIRIKLVNTQLDLEEFSVFLINQQPAAEYKNPRLRPNQDAMFLNYILDWNWKLTACDLFTIDYKLFTMVSS